MKKTFVTSNNPILTPLVLAIGLYASAALAAPNCNPIPYGAKCTQCSGWMGYKSWSQVACNLTTSPNAAGFACSPLKCAGVVETPDVVESPNKKQVILPENLKRGG